MARGRFNPAVAAVCGCIRLYRLLISPYLGNCCRFEPSCSAYALEAYARFGFWRGGALAVWRVLRCQPFCQGGYDPVPRKKERFVK